MRRQSRSRVPLDRLFGWGLASTLVLVIAAALSVEVAGPPSVASKTVVIAHSYTGSTAIVAAELARMLGAPLRLVHDPPSMPAARPIGPAVSDVDLRVAADATRILLGSPIWGEAPTPAAFESIRRMNLRGRTVTFFFTYVHYVAPEHLARLREAVESAGGRFTEPMPFLFPFAVSDDFKRLAAQRAVLARTDLWRDPDARPPQPDCAVRNAVTGALLCAVPAGSTWLGGNLIEHSDPGARPPLHEAVPAFVIDRAEVTVADYRKCVAAGRCPDIPLDVDPCRVLGTVHPTDPMPCVDWKSAEAFCSWAGMRLPTEAEWTRAARADTAATYPWGEDPPGGEVLRGNFGEPPGKGLPGYELADASWRVDSFAGLAPGCSFAAGNSPFGICDLAGNLNEWVDADGCGGPVSPRGMLKGGAWLDASAPALQVGTHGCFDKSLGSYLMGFRCAQSR